MDKMQFNEFKNEIVAKIREYLPETFKDAEVSLQVVHKNNLELTGIVIRSIESNISPTIYLDSFYSQYESGEGMSEILQKIAEVRVNHELEDNFDVECITNWERCRERIIPRIVCLEDNKAFLAEKVYTTIADLAVTYCILLEESYSDGAMTVSVTKQLMNNWGLMVDELHEAAINNMPSLVPSTFRSMAEVMKDMLAMSDEEYETLPMSSDEQMFVLTNELKLNGAAAILDTDLMLAIFEKIGEFYILPSSIHEVLIVPMSSNIHVSELKAMVKEVNDTQVSPEDRLSYSIYYYNPVDGFCIA